MRSCQIHRSFFDGILAWGGPVLLENCIFTDCDRAISAHPGSVVTVRNSVFDRNRRSLFVHGGTLNAYNTIVTNGIQSSVGWDFGARNVFTEHCIFWSPEAASGEFEGVSSQIGQQGNLNVDPLFVDSSRNDFRLSYGSPALDSADGARAPEFDYLGTLRVDEPSAANTGTPAANGNHPDRGAFEFSENAESPLDLIVSSVSGPTKATVGETVTVHWTVVNRGSAPVMGSWTDRISLVRNPGTENEEVRFAAEVPGGGYLGPGESLELLAEVVVPGALEGPHRWQVETNSRSTVFEGLNRNNNMAVSTASVDIALPELIVGGESFAGQFDQVGGGYWFLLNAASGDVVIDARVNGDDRAVTGIYLGYGTLPNRNQHDGKQVEFGSDDVSALVPRQGSPVYVFVTADSLDNPGVGVTISANPVEFSIKSVSPRSIGNTGSATLEVNGAALGEHLDFELVATTGEVYPASSVYATNSLQAFPTFPLNDLPHGNYKVRARSGAALIESIDSVEVTETIPAELEVNMVADDNVRAGRNAQLNFSYQNAGNVDLIAPIMKTIATVEKKSQVVFGVARAKTRAFLAPALPVEKVKYVRHYLAVSETGPAGIIRPTAFGGAFTTSLDVPVDEPNMEVRLRWIAESQKGTAFPVGGLKPRMKPHGATREGWDRVFNNLLALTGGTYGGFNALVAETATQIGRTGRRENNFLRLLGLSTRLADPSGSLITLGEERKVGRLLPDLTKNQVEEPVGGWDQSSILIVDFLGTRRFYEETLDPNRFVPSVDDGSELIKDGTDFTINEFDGSSISFSENGTRLESFTDGLAITIEARYEGDQLVRLEENGEVVLTFVYDANGFLAKQIFFDGREINYTHNNEGELTALQHVFGPPMIFAYHTDGPGAGLLKSMGFENSLAELTYDDLGRLQSMTSEGSTTNYSYLAFGKTRIEQDGRAFVETTDQFNNIISVRGPEGREALVEDREGKTTYTSANGASLSLEYDEGGYLSRLVNAAGIARKVTVDPVLELLTSVTDPHGGLTAMSYTPQGELSEINFPDGSAAYQTFDARSNGETWTNRAGETIRLEFAPGTDRAQTRILPDGDREEFTYDAVGRILTATNSVGTTSFEYNDAGAITKVTYPHGHSLTYEYDILGRRVSMTDDAGFTTQYRFNEVGQLDGVLNGASEEWVEYEFDSVGRVAQRNYANGVVSAYQYDQVTGGLESVIHQNSENEVINQVIYTSDSVGTRLGKVTIDGETNYTYDATKQLVSQSGADGDYSFAYDAAGNRTQANRLGTVTDYLADSLDRYLEAGNTSFTYNADGDLTSSNSRDETFVYDYDAEGKLLGYQGAGLNVVYQYDALGTRISEIVNGVEKHYLLDPVGDMETVGAITSEGRSRFIFSQHGLIAQVSDGNAYYYHEDGSYNVTEITDSAQEVVNSYRYSPFGKVVNQVESVSNDFTFGGSLGNIETANDQYWIYLRQYDPDLGRFHVLDPARYPGYNGYLYGSNDPINRIDINGNDSSLSAYIADDTRNNGATGIGLTNALTDEAVRLIRQEINNFTHHTEVENAERALARERRAYNKQVNEYEGKVRKQKPGISKKQNRKRAKRGPSNKRVKTSRRNLKNVKKNGPTKATGTKGAKGLSLLGTANSLYNFNETLQSYRNGEIPAYEMVHGVGVLGGDLIQYAPGLGTVGSIIATVADPVSQSAFGWWHTPTEQADEDVFGPRGLELINGQRSRSRIVGSYDPNDKASTGIGERGFMTNGTPITYTIRFENLETASAAAQQVVVTDPLDHQLDWSTFQLLDFGFNGKVFTDALGQQGYRGVHEVSSDPNPVRVDISLDPLTGLLRFEATSFDPLTQDYPANPFAGFLPPNDDTGRGEGFLKFSIWPKSGLSDGTRIENEARIVFDLNPPIDTNVAVNTIDLQAPTSSVAEFSAGTLPNFIVELNGDDGEGVGIDYYEIYLSTDGGPFTFYKVVEDDSFLFEGMAGVNYAFYSIATDQLGFAEPSKTSSDASVTPVNLGEDPYEDWAAAQFGADAGNPFLEATLWGKQADPDGDGFANILESYMNLDPQVHDTANAFRATTSDDLFTVIYSRSKSNWAAAELRPQRSIDAQTWTNQGIQEEIIEDLGDWVRVRATIAREGNRTMFFRLRIQ